MGWRQFNLGNGVDLIRTFPWRVPSPVESTCAISVLTKGGAHSSPPNSKNIRPNVGCLTTSAPTRGSQFEARSPRQQLRLTVALLGAPQLGCELLAWGLGAYHIHAPVPCTRARLHVRSGARASPHHTMAARAAMIAVAVLLVAAPLAHAVVFTSLNDMAGSGIDIRNKYSGDGVTSFAMADGSPACLATPYT